MSFVQHCISMTLKLPIATLRVFEAAARRQSFHAAATELNLTPSAVSHAIRKMEESLGVVLFERVGRGVSLSSEGQTLMGYTERAFDELQRGFEAVSARAPRLLRLHCAPSFAAQWLTPRLARFFVGAPRWRCAWQLASNTRASIRANSTQTSFMACRGRKVWWCFR